jgi:hypothetical protein
MWRIDSLSVGILILGWVAKAKIAVGCRLPAASTSSRPLEPITIAGTGDHDPMETMITIVWNAHGRALPGETYSLYSPGTHLSL